jgi:preprotein translocase subunit SecF
MEEVQIAPTALHMTYAGNGVASISASSAKIDIILSGAEVENATYSFPFTTYATLGALKDGFSTVPNLSVDLTADGSVSAEYIVQSAHENPRLSMSPYALHYLLPTAEPIALDKIRAAVDPIGSVSVQVLGKSVDRKFMIRVEDPGTEVGFSKAVTEKISAALDASFGSDNIVVSRTDFVGARFSKNLTDQAALLVFMTLGVILLYAWLRFKKEFALGAVLAILHDAFIMVAFMAWTRMEFNTTSIAAILTILGYSINDTIVIFDRIRENTRLHPEETITQVINRSVTEMLGRTIITTVTTMLAVLSLFFFTTGSMKDFALALVVGMVSGVYSTIFIASAFIHWWNEIAKKRASRAPKVSSFIEPKKA